MARSKFTYLGLMASLLIACTGPANAQTIGFADAFSQLSISCGKDIEKYCKKVNLGGGRVQQCLSQNQASVSAGCKANMAGMVAQLQKRAAARVAVGRVCEGDIQRFCAGIQPGDGNLLECFAKVKRNIGAQCRQAVTDAGYDVSLASAPVKDQINLDSSDIVSSLQGVEASSAQISAAGLRQLVAQGMKDPSRANRMNREPLSVELSKHAQLTIAIQFDLNSARIRPESFRGVGLMADALYHPYLQGYRFLIVGNTDATGSREHNLKLSQERADAIREALIKPFGINPARIEAVGLGEEQLLDPAHPDAAENRRVQLINIGM
jgi:outer membrane protein OmpA-like peptidoglycan-associated protein